MAGKEKLKKPVSGTTQSKKSSTEKGKSSPGKKKASVKKTPAKKVPAKTGRKGKRAYSLMGELTITTSQVPPIKADQKKFKTPEIVVDSKGSMFTKTSLELMIDNRRAIAVLDAEQVEILLKLLRVVDYAD